MKERIQFVLREGSNRGVLRFNEEKFLHSILKQVERQRYLSVNQNNWFQSIESKVKDACDGTWDNEWNTEKARKLGMAINYYKNSPDACVYFRDIIQWVEDNPDKIISKTNYKKIVENKYAQKIIHALSVAPKYADGDVVCYRANKGPRNFRAIPLFILKPLDRAVNAVNGARLYLVLPSNSASPLEIEERDLKPWRGKKAKNS